MLPPKTGHRASYDFYTQYRTDKWHSPSTSDLTNKLLLHAWSMLRRLVFPTQPSPNSVPNLLIRKADLQYVLLLYSWSVISGSTIKWWKVLYTCGCLSVPQLFWPVNQALEISWSLYQSSIKTEVTEGQPVSLPSWLWCLVRNFSTFPRFAVQASRFL